MTHRTNHFASGALPRVLAGLLSIAGCLTAACGRGSGATSSGTGGAGGAGATSGGITGATSSVGGTSNASASTAESATSSGTSTTGTGQYCTTFDATENPISEGGKWVQQGGLTGLDWTDVQTKNGVAFGTLTGLGGYDDSVALLSGFGPNQRVTAKIHFVGQRSSSTDTHEVELMLRGSYTAHMQSVYECNLGYAGASGWYSQIVRQDGAIGAFQDITQGVAPVPEVHDGDTFTAEIIGDTINTYVNGVKVGTATDAAIPTGQPGVGFFWRATENVDDFAFTSICADPI